jgi:hypothetical protein
MKCNQDDVLNGEDQGPAGQKAKAAERPNRHCEETIMRIARGECLSQRRRAGSSSHTSAHRSGW